MKKLVLLLAVVALAASSGCRHTCGWRMFGRNDCCTQSYDSCGCGTSTPYEGQVIYGGTTTMPGPATQ